MEDIKKLREKYYHIVRYIAVFIIGPLLICKGNHYDDNILIIIISPKNILISPVVYF